MVLQLIFPSYCAACGAPDALTVYCKACWEYVVPLHPFGRCVHCFTEGDELCRLCAGYGALGFPRAALFEPTPQSYRFVRRYPDMIPFFFLYSWSQLDWDPPDYVIPMPGMEASALAIAKLMRWGYVRMRTDRTSQFRIDPELMEEGATVLFIDRASSMEGCRGMIRAIGEAFPKSGYILQLYLYDFVYHRSGHCPPHHLLRVPSCP